MSIGKTLKTDIYNCIKANDVTNLDQIIENYLSDNSINMSVDEWKIANYKQLRKWAFPDPCDMVVSLIKRHSKKPVVEAQGQAEIDAFVSRYEQVIAFFPSE